MYDKPTFIFHAGMNRTTDMIIDFTALPTLYNKILIVHGDKMQIKMSNGFTLIKINVP